MIATLWIFLALAALARADENGDRDVIRTILGTFNDQASQVMRAMLAGPQVPLYHFLSADYAITDAFLAG
jgi:hypothetical protein